jgi:hypothetical protein
MSLSVWIEPTTFMLHAHIPLASLAACLGFPILGPLPQRALG